MTIDLEIPLSSLPRDVYRIIGLLAPFGEGNPVPLFLSRDVQLVGSRRLGSNGDHLLLKLHDRGVTWDAVAFQQAKHLPAHAKAIDIVYSIEIDRWGPEETLRLNVKDLRPAQGDA